MYYVIFGEWGDCYGEYEEYEMALKVAEHLEAQGEDAWIVSDDYFEEDSNLEMGFDPYSGCYDWDC